MKNYRMKCRNTKCGADFLRRYNNEEFDRLQYGATPGIACFTCGYPKMIVMRSKQQVKDGFTPGFQKNIRKHCATYSEYKAHLKKMGLIELGYEDLPKADEYRTQYWDDDLFRKINNEYGLELSGNEAEYLKTLHKKRTA